MTVTMSGSGRGWLQRATRLSLAILAVILTSGALWAQDTLSGAPSHGPRFLRAANGDLTRIVPLEAESTSVLNRVITLDVEDARFGDLVREVSDQIGVHLVYSSELISPDRRVTIQAERVPLSNLLSELLRDANVDVVLSGNQATLVRKAKPVVADTGIVVVHVRIVGTGEPLVSAQVVLDGGRNGLTNEHGVAIFRGVPAGEHTVEAVLIGYKSSTATVVVHGGEGTEKPPAQVVLELEVSPTKLNEVVVTATGEERRRVELGNDITVINVDSIVAREPITSVTDLLEGRVPGLVVQRTSGAPGDPARIRLRGVSSPNGSNDPIVVVDGIRAHGPQSGERGVNLASGDYATTYNAPSPLDYIDPRTIATIQVLKGPSAATIYGPDAANGVIVITTKKGHAGKARWNASLEHGRSRIAGEFPELYVRWGRRIVDDTRVICPVNWRVSEAFSSACLPDEVVSQQLLNNSEHTVLGSGNSTGMSVGVSGGNAGVTYRVDASYRDEVGLPRLPGYAAESFQQTYGRVVPGWMQRPQHLKQWGVQSSLQMDLGGSARASLTSRLSRTDQQRSSLERQLGQMMATYMDPVTGMYYRGGEHHLAPLHDAVLSEYTERATARATQFINAVNVTWQPRRWLTLKADAGLDAVWRADEVLAPFGTVSEPEGRLAVGQGTSVVGTARIGANGDVPLGLGFRLRMAAGVDYTGTVTENMRTAVTLAEDQESLTGAVEVNDVGQNVVDDATFGWFIQPGIAHRRMWLNLGLRFDGGSAYGSRTNVDLPTFPKLSFSYLISDEPYFPDFLSSIFNTLRLRVAYGHAGRQPGPGDRLRLYGAPVQDWVGTGEARTVLLHNLGNAALKPERSREFEGGFDADLFNDRLSVNFTSYHETTEDAILEVPIPPSVYGLNVKRLENIGVVRNTGLELNLDLEPVRTDLVTWRLGLNFSQNRNVVVELGPGVDPFYVDEGGVRVAPGYPLFGRWAKPVLGYTDSNGDGVLDPAEVVYGDTAVYVGGTLPEYTAGLHSTLSLFRGVLSISAGLLYEDGMTQENRVGNTLRWFSRGWNDPSSSLAEQLAAIDRSGYTSTQTVNSLRLNSLSVNYVVPTSMSRWFGADALTLSLQGTNLGLWTNYSGLDPNVNGSMGANSVVDTGVLPAPRTWQIRVNATY